MAPLVHFFTSMDVLLDGASESLEGNILVQSKDARWRFLTVSAFRGLARHFWTDARTNSPMIIAAVIDRPTARGVEISW